MSKLVLAGMLGFAALSCALGFVPSTLLGLQRGYAASCTSQRTRNTVASTRRMPEIRMGLRAVEDYDARFELSKEPVPYSPNTPHGMPKEFEEYYLNPDYAIINVPPQYMFEAKCFKPSRLCAIFELKGVDEAYAAKIREDKARSMRKASASEPGGEAWPGMGHAMAVAREMGVELDDDELDGMVV